MNWVGIMGVHSFLDIPLAVKNTRVIVNSSSRYERASMPRGTTAIYIPLVHAMLHGHAPDVNRFPAGTLRY
jgi:hypothetical protein